MLAQDINAFVRINFKSLADAKIFKNIQAPFALFNFVDPRVITV